MDTKKGSRGKREQRKAIAILGAILLAIILVIAGIVYIIVSICSSGSKEAEAQQTETPKLQEEQVIVEAPKEVEEEITVELPEPVAEEIEEEAVSENELPAIEEEEQIITPAKDARALAWADEQLSKMSLEQKVAQLFIITPEALTGHGSVVGEAKEKTRNALKTYPVGGVIYYDQNIGSVSQVTALLGNTQKYVSDQSEVPIFLAVDEEGGQLARVANYSPMKATKVGDMSDIGASGDANAALEAGETIGSYLSELGFNLDFAPVADVLVDADNKLMAKRSFGEAPAIVWEMDEQFLKGLGNHQVAGCLKYFPGYALTSADPYKGTVKVDMSKEELETYAFAPYKEASKAGVEMMMVGQVVLTSISDEELPACLSEDVVSGILRSEFGYDGVLVTDVMNKGVVSNYAPEEAAAMAVLAGMDMLLTPKDFKKAYQGVLHAVSEGKLTEARIDESVKRILTMKYRYQTE